MKNTEINYDIIVTGQIAAGTGHEDFKGTVSEAVKKIIQSCKEFGMWAVINGELTFFDKYDSKEEEELARKLVSVVEPNFSLINEIIGGSN